jgi:hypothetical protein
MMDALKISDRLANILARADTALLTAESANLPANQQSALIFINGEVRDSIAKLLEEANTALCIERAA